MNRHIDRVQHGFLHLRSTKPPGARLGGNYFAHSETPNKQPSANLLKFTREAGGGPWSVWWCACTHRCVCASVRPRWDFNVLGQLLLGLWATQKDTGVRTSAGPYVKTLRCLFRAPADTCMPAGVCGVEPVLNTRIIKYPTEHW
jgi:hypothetical protein